MVIKNKVVKDRSTPIQTSAEETANRVIERGGKTIADAAAYEERGYDHEVRFTLRVSRDLIAKIDEARGRRAGNISRNQWIVETISQRLEQ
jgi:predicted HicB family RNase H-like nuclease